ncbi:MAG TPA: hypothetical protein VKY65_19200 [Alphaproteobacteria bacterium]|nr:hypothetical protein [Alphaproteobacteria bacterium]
MIRNNSLRLIAIIVGLFVLGCETGSRAAQIPKKIDEDTALQLVADAAGRRANEFGYDSDKSKLNAPFFVYADLAPLPEQGFFGFFAVNPWTGDVWTLWGCYKLISEVSRATQLEIRKHFTPDELKQYARLSRLKPSCDSTDDLAELGY